MVVLERPVPKRLINPIKPMSTKYTTKPTRVYNIRKQRYTWIAATAPTPQPIADLAAAFDTLSLKPTTSSRPASVTKEQDRLPDLDPSLVEQMYSIFGTPSDAAANLSPHPIVSHASHDTTEDVTRRLDQLAIK